MLTSYVNGPIVETQLLHSQSNKEYLVAGVARFSPMLGRRLARVLGTPPPQLLAVDSMAQKLAADWLKEGIDEYLIFSAFTQSSTGIVSQSSQETELSEKLEGDGVPTFYRYYHVFKEGELISVVSQIPSLKIVQSYYDHANWCVVAEKQ